VRRILHCSNELLRFDEFDRIIRSSATIIHFAHFGSYSLLRGFTGDVAVHPGGGEEVAVAERETRAAQVQVQRGCGRVQSGSVTESGFPPSHLRVAFDSAFCPRFRLSRMSCTTVWAESIQHLSGTTCFRTPHRHRLIPDSQGTQTRVTRPSTSSKLIHFSGDQRSRRFHRRALRINSSHRPRFGTRRPVPTLLPERPIPTRFCHP